MKVYKIKNSHKLTKGSKNTEVLILESKVTTEEANRLLGEFPNSLMIAENTLESEPKEGYFNILRIKSSSLEEAYKRTTPNNPYKAVLVENKPSMFYSELLATREEIAKNFNLPVERIRFCCNFASQQGSDNLSCYAANALRDYAAEMGLVEVSPTSRQEVLSEESMCLCVKSELI